MISDELLVGELGFLSRAKARAAALVARLTPRHSVPAAVLIGLDALMLRNYLFTSKAPGGVDSAFLYSMLPYFKSHGLGTFSVWLSAPFGEVQQYSEYWFLAAVVSLVGHALLVYKLSVFFTVVGSSASSYALSYWLSRSQFASGVAAFLYTLSPFAIAQGLAGHLNVEISYAVGPLAVWLFWMSLRERKRRAMVGFGLAGSALFLLTTGQGVYWLLPLVCVAGVELTVGVDRGRRAVVAVLETAAVGGVAFVAASAVQILPSLFGERAPYVADANSLYISQLSIHAKYSLPFIKGVVGVPREVYLSGVQTIGAAPFNSAPFEIAGFMVVVIASLSLVLAGFRIAATLFLSALAAWLLAAGPYGPLHHIYVLLYWHVPYFRLLRAPNRWLMVSGLAISTCTALTIANTKRLAGGFIRSPQRLARRLGLFVVVLGLVLGSYGLTNGLPAWTLPKPYAKSFSPLASDPGEWRILTTPFWQAWMLSGRRFNPHQSLTADLGFTSAVWHHHAVVDRGGWDPRAARFVRYLYELTLQGTNTSMTKLLGAAGVKYIALEDQSFHEVLPGQNEFFARQKFVTPIVRGGAQPTVLRVTKFQPEAFVARSSCVVVGGLRTLGDLALQPQVSFARTSFEFADQIAVLGGKAGLRSQIEKSRCLVLAPGGRRELAVLLGAASEVQLADHAPRGWSRLEMSPSLDIQAEPDMEVDTPPGGHINAPLVVPKSGNYDLFLSALHASNQQRLLVRVDGKRAGTIILKTAAGSGVQWSRIALGHLDPGTHTVSVAYPARRYEVDAHLVSLALVPTAAADSALRLPRTETLIREHGGAGPIGREPMLKPANEESVRSAPWHSLSGPRFVHARTAPDGGLSLSVVRRGREYYTLVDAPTKRSINPYRPIAIRFKGTGSGRTFYLNFTFGDTGAQRVGYRFRDTSSSTRTIVFSPLQPDFQSAVPRWDAIRSVSLSVANKKPFRRPIFLRGPFSLGRSLAPRFNTEGLNWLARAGAGSTVALADRAAPITDTVPLRPTNRGVLVYTQSYNPGWSLSGARSGATHTIALGFANAFVLPHKLDASSLGFGPARLGRIGTYLSAAAWLLCLLAIAAGWDPVRRRLRSADG